MADPGQLLKDSFKRDTILLAPLERHLLIKQQQEDAERDLTMLHPSSMAKHRWCSRHDYYELLWPETRVPEANRFQTDLIYENGHYIHEKYQNWFAEMGILWGRWRCGGCRRWWWGHASDLDYCVCGALNWKYREVPLSLPTHRMVGHTDGVVISDGVPRLLEIKSIGPGTIRVNNSGLYKRFTDGDLTLDGMWREIKRPFPDHVRQGMLYLRMCLAWSLAVGADIVPNIREMVFLYEWKPNQATKEFKITYEESLIADILQKALVVAVALQNYITPDRPGWAAEKGPETSTCKTCTYRDHCWSDHAQPPAAAPEPTTVAVRSVSRADRRKRLGNLPTSS